MTPSHLNVAALGIVALTVLAIPVVLFAVFWWATVTREDERRRFAEYVRRMEESK